MSMQLPDDLNRWPTDPYRLLGLQPGASATEARRAYTKLVRQFKPEQFPDHFRRIRDAYEAVRSFAEYPFFPGPSAEPPLSNPPLSNPPLSSELTDLESSASSREDPIIPNHDLTFNLGMMPVPPSETGAADDALARLWERAVRGDELAAYRGLRELADQPDRAVDACLRLYWLLRAAPELDPACSPCDWLVRGMRGGGWHSACHELYRREIEHQPAEALSSRFEALLEAQAPLQMLAEWLRWRWLAAGRLGDSQVIIEDIERMRPRFVGTLDDEMWGILLIDAVDQLAWAPGRAAAQATAAACEEIEQLIHLHSMLDLHRLDVLRDLVRSWRAIADVQHVPKIVLELARASWTGAPAELRDRIRRATHQLLQAPEHGLALLDDLKSRAPLVFAQFAGLIDRAVWETAWEENYVAPPDLAPFAASFAEAEVTDAAAPPREEFLRFCLENVVVPMEVLDANPDFPAPVADQLRQDEVIRVLCTAYRWFWA